MGRFHWSALWTLTLKRVRVNEEKTDVRQGQQPNADLKIQFTSIHFHVSIFLNLHTNLLAFNLTESLESHPAPFLNLSICWFIQTSFTPFLFLQCFNLTIYHFASGISLATLLKIFLLLLHVIFFTLPVFPASVWLLRKKDSAKTKKLSDNVLSQSGLIRTLNPKLQINQSMKYMSMK